MKKKSRILHGLIKFSSATFLSRITGLIRDILKAQYFGTSMFADAFDIAFRLPNSLRAFLAEGSLSAAFVPVFTHVKNKMSKKDQNQLWNNMFFGLFIVTVLITLIFVIFAPAILRIVVSGFGEDSQKMELTIFLTRLLFPYIVFISLASLYTGVLNSYKIFFRPAFIPVILNLSMIFGMIAFIPYLKNIGLPLIYSIAAGAVIGGAGQLLFLIPVGYKLGFKVNLKPLKFWQNKHLRKIAKLMLPGLFGTGVREVNLLVDAYFASWFAGGMAALTYGNRVMLLPIGLVAISFSTVLLPAFSEYSSEKNKEKFGNILAVSIRANLFLMIPVMFVLIFFGDVLIRILFVRGAFSLEKSLPMSFEALKFYSLGIIAYSINKTIASAFYSFQNTKTPMYIGAFAMVVNIGLNYIFVKMYGFQGIALASSISAYVQLLILSVLFYKNYVRFLNKTLIFDISKILFSSFIVIIAVQKLSETYQQIDNTLFYNLIFLSIVSFVMISAYFLLSYIFRVRIFSMLLKRINIK